MYNVVHTGLQDKHVALASCLARQERSQSLLSLYQRMGVLSDATSTGSMGMECGVAGLAEF